MVDLYSPNAAIQTSYLPVTDFPPPGAAWRGSHGQTSELLDTACGDMRPLTKGVYKITNTANTNGEAWKISYDGVLIPFTTGASAAATMSAINTALATVFGAGKALEEDVSGIVLSSPDVTISFADGTTHTISLVAPGGAASTFTAAYTTTPSAPFDHPPGMWVARDTAQFDPQLIHVKRPDSVTDAIYGLTTNECVHPTSDTHSSLGGAADAWPANRPMTVWRRGQAVGVAYGAVDKAYMSKTVYAVVTGVHAGKSMVSNGGTQATDTLTVTPSATDTVGFHFDSLPALTVTSVNLATDNAALAAKFNSDAQYQAKGSAVVSAGKIVITWSDYLDHTFADDSSGGTADVATVKTAAVAPIAVATNSTFMTPAANGEGVAIQVNQA